MQKKPQSIYEGFHKTTGIQNKIIGKKNFTYGTLIGLLEKYLTNKNRILDIGCGAGTVDFYLANLGYKIVGVDISESAIESCRKSASELGLEDKLEFRKLDFPEEKPREKFDFVICSEVLEHLQNDGKATRAIFGLLNPRGIVIFSVPSKNAPLYKIGTTGAFDKKAGHLRRYSLKELKNLTLRAGFLIQETIKKEGVLRNFLFLNPIAGKFVRILNKIEFLSELFTFIDDLTIPLFGESDVFLVARKP